jgi:transcriptional regulator with XRE-family HTH domain
MPRKNQWAPYAVEVGARLRKTRIALGYEFIAPFAEDTGTDADNLSNWERGVSMVPPGYVRGLKSRFGIRFDWIYDEDATLMDPKIAKALLTVDRRKRS